MFAAFAAAALPAGDTLAWKPIDDAMLKTTWAPKSDKTWNLFQATRKKNLLLLLQLGRRYLVLNIKERTVTELDASRVVQNSKGVKTPNPEAEKGAGKPVASTGWIVHDIGVAYEVEFTLTADTRAIDIQLPHTPDLRGIY